MSPSCKDVADILVDYADGQLSAEQAGAVAEHLAECEGCRELLEALRLLDVPKSGEPAEGNGPLSVIRGTLTRDVGAIRVELRLHVAGKPAPVWETDFASDGADVSGTPDPRSHVSTPVCRDALPQGGPPPGPSPIRCGSGVPPEIKPARLLHSRKPF